MSIKTLIHNLNELCDRLDAEFDINYGGCCFVAAVLAEELRLANISYEVVIWEGGSHYAIHTKYGYINKAGYTFRRSRDEKVVIDSDNLYREYYNTIWNDVYQTIYNFEVKKLLRQEFQKYGKN